MHLEDRDYTPTPIPKRQLVQLIIYDHTLPNLNQDSIMSPLPVHLLHHNLSVHSLNPIYTERHLQNTLRMAGTLIQLGPIVSPSHPLNLGDHSMRSRRHLLACVDQRVGPRHCMIRLPLGLPRLYFLEGRIHYTIIRLLIPLNHNRKVITIDPIGSLAPHLLELNHIEISHLQTVDPNDYLMNELLILKDGFLYLDGMILEILQVPPECLKRPKFNDLSRRRIRTIRPDKRIGRQSWVI